MSTVDDRIVSLKLNSQQFEAASKVAIGTLGRLQQSLNFGGGKNGLDQVQDSANRFNMGNVAGAVEGVSAKFVALSTVAITALTNIANKAVDAGLTMAKSLTVDPIMEGFQEYELKMGSIQTILANTSRHGTGLDEVTSSLDQLNTYADKTIYNFGDMTKNIGLFTNAGIKVEDATAMIQGFSNEAAASGTTSQGAAGAAYQLSQALSAGQITLMDWRSLTNVGMGNKNMQNGIIEIAEAMGAFEGTAMTAEEAAKDFNGSLEKKWLKADVMENYLKIQAEGNKDVSRSMMEQIGLSDEQITKFQAQQETAFDAATKVRTWTQLIGTLQEGVGSSWATTFDILLGDFNQATELFTNIFDTLGPMIDQFGDARNKLLTGWASMGGREDLIAGLSNAFKALMAIITPIGQAFREIFPPMTLATLVNMTQAFEKFTAGLIIGGEKADQIKRIFSGVFAIFGIGWEVVKSVASALFGLLGVVGQNSGGFLEFAAKIGDWITSVHSALKSGGLLGAFFQGLSGLVTYPIQAVGALGSGLLGLTAMFADLGGTIKMVWDILATGDFKGGPWGEDSKIVSVLFAIREGFQWVASAAEQAWNILAKGDFVSGVWSEDSPIVDGLFRLRDIITKFFSFDNIAKMLGIGAAGGLALGIRTLLKDGIGIGIKDSEPLLESLKGMFESVKGSFDGVSDILGSLTGALTTMQNNIKANILLKIAAAVGILAAAILVLSTIDGDDLAKSLSAITVAFGQLLGGLAILTVIAKGGAIASLPAMATAILILATAILVMASAVQKFSEMSWGELVKGLVGVAGALGVLIAGAFGLNAVSGGITRIAIAMVPLAVALRLMAGAVEQLGTMPWDDMLRGIGGLAGVIVGVGLALKAMPPNLMVIGAGLALVGSGIAPIAASVRLLGGMDWKDLIEGVIGLVSAVAGIGIALSLMPPQLATIGVGLLIVSTAITGIATAVTVMGKMTWEEVARGIVALGGALAILVTALNLMNGTIAGSAALFVAAGAIGMLAPAMAILGTLSWEAILKGLAALAGVFTVLGVAGLVLTPVVPTILALGIALLALGAGMAAAGVGATALVAAFTALAAAVGGTAAGFGAIIVQIPELAKNLALGIVEFVRTMASHMGEIVDSFKNLMLKILQTIAEMAPEIGRTMLALLFTLLDIVIQASPKIADAFMSLLMAILRILGNGIPAIAQTGLNLIISLLEAMAEGIPRIVTVVGNIIVSFLNALGAKLPEIIDAGYKFIISFINGLTEAINNNSEEMGIAGGNLAVAIINGMVKGLKGGGGVVASWAKSVALGALNAAKDALGIRSPSRAFAKVGMHSTEGMAEGFRDGESRVEKAAVQVATKTITAVGDSLKEGMSSAISEATSILFKGDFTGKGPWAADSPIVGTLFDIRKGFLDLGGAAAEAHGILTRGDFTGKGPWAADSPIVNTLFNVRNGFMRVGDAANEAIGILSTGDFRGIGPWTADSPIVDALFRVREGFVKFKSVSDDAINGMVKGFRDGQTKVNDWARRVAEDALRAAQRALGIRSPSRKFAEIGMWSGLGLAKGLEDQSGNVSSAATSVADEMLVALAKSMRSVDEILNDDLNFNPVLKPVLDLSDFNRNASVMQDAFSDPSLNVGSAFARANDILSETNARAVTAAERQPVVEQKIEFTQNNHSPKALSASEIYRQTRSQLSMAKEALNA